MAPDALATWIARRMEPKLIRVVFCARGGVWKDEYHISDPITLPETIRMTMDRTGARYAIHRSGTGWVLIGGRKQRREFTTREAAEMTAIHNG